MQLTTKHYYDDETFEHVKSKFYIDGEEVDFEAYMDFIGGLEEYNKDTEELTEDNPYEYNDEDETCECDECKYKDKKKYDSCDDDCKYINCDECCNDFCDCENEGCEGCTEDNCCGECNECNNDIYIDDEMDCGISEECIDCDDTECENQISSEELEELKIIASFTEEVLKRDGCPDCIFGLLGDLYVKGKNVGWQNHKDYIMMCNE